MAYTPNEWACGDTLTAEKLNNIERGISEMNSEYVPTEWQCGDTITADHIINVTAGGNQPKLWFKDPNWAQAIKA